MVKNHLTHERGFSLLELLTAVSIAGILLARAIPQISELSAAYKLRQVVNELDTDLGAARRLALKEGAYVVFTLTDSGRGYSFGVDRFPLNTPPASDSTNYSKVLQGSYTISSTTEVIFNPRGFVIDDTARPQSIQLVLAGPGGRSKTVTLLPTGFLRE